MNQIVKKIFIIVLALKAGYAYAEPHTPWPGNMTYYFEDLLMGVNGNSSPLYQDCLRTLKTEFTNSPNCITQGEMNCVVQILTYSMVKHIPVNATDNYKVPIDTNKSGLIEQDEINFVKNFTGCYSLGDRNLDGRVDLAEFRYIYDFSVFTGGVSYLSWTNGDRNGDNKISTAELGEVAGNLNEIAGDASLNGCVGYEDFIILNNNWGQPSSSRWTLGDFNWDGTVDSADYQQLITHYGQCRPVPQQSYLPADLDHDGCVTSLDYNIWRANYGKTPNASTPGDIDKNGSIDSMDYILYRNALGTCRP